MPGACQAPGFFMRRLAPAVATVTTASPGTRATTARALPGRPGSGLPRYGLRSQGYSLRTIARGTCQAGLGRDGGDGRDDGQWAGSLAGHVWLRCDWDGCCGRWDAVGDGDR